MNIIQHFQALLNLEQAKFEPIVHQDAMVADVYKIVQPNKPDYILKVCLREKDFLRESYFLTLFANKIPVPTIIQAVKPHEAFPGALMMSYLPGAVLEPQDISEQLALRMGQLLATIHLQRTTVFGDLTNTSNQINDPKEYFARKFEENFDECKDALPISLLNKCANYFNEHLHLLDSVDGPCVAHLDYRPGNCVVNNGNIEGIIDWASARSGFAQEDFVAIEHDYTSKDNTSVKKAFNEGYSSKRTLPNYKHIMPLLRINKALASIGFLTKTNKQLIHPEFYEYNLRFVSNFSW